MGFWIHPKKCLKVSIEVSKSMHGISYSKSSSSGIKVFLHTLRHLK